MINMQLFGTNVVRAVLYGIGFLWAIYQVYNIKPSKMIIVDLFISISIYFVMNISYLFFPIKELVFFVSAIIIISGHHKHPITNALKFSIVIVFMLVFTYPIAIFSLAIFPRLIQAIELQSNDIYGYFAVILPSLIFIIIYQFSARYVKHKINVFDMKTRRINNMTSILNIMIIIVFSFLLNYIINHMGTFLSLQAKYFFMSFAFLGVILIPFTALYFIQEFSRLETEINELEKDIEATNDSRIIAYRYNHNFNNIMLSLHHLSKDGKKEEIKAYLEKVEIN